MDAAAPPGPSRAPEALPALPSKRLDSMEQKLAEMERSTITRLQAMEQQWTHTVEGHKHLATTMEAMEVRVAGEMQGLQQQQQGCEEKLSEEY